MAGSTVKPVRTTPILQQQNGTVRVVAPAKQPGLHRDEEDAAPANPVDQHAAEDGAEDGAEHNCDSVHSCQMLTARARWPASG